MKVNKLIYGTLLKLTALSLILASPAYSSPNVVGDFDADGKSDLSVALVNRTSNSTAWLTRLTSGAAPLSWNFNKAADALVIGRFYSANPKYYPAIVRVTSTTQPLEWTFKTATNSEIVTRFGLPGDIITNLGDWDGDGREDTHVVRKSPSSELQWYVYLTAYATTVQVGFGLDGDQVGVSDVDNDGLVELVALRNGFNWYVRKPFLGRETTTATQWGLNGDIPLLPRDLDGDNLPDFIISRVVGGGQVAYIRYGNGQAKTMNLGSSTSLPQVGRFDNNSNFAWSQRDTGWTAIGKPDASSIDLFRFGISTNVVIRPDGTVVQPTSSGAAFGVSAAPISTTGSSAAASFAACSQVSTVPAGGTFIYKQSAPLRSPTTNQITGYRYEPTLIMNRKVSSLSQTTIFDSEGNVIGTCPKASAHGHAGGRFRCTMQTSAVRREAVSNTGSPTIFFQLGANSCARIPDAGRCYGSVKGPCDRLID